MSTSLIRWMVQGLLLCLLTPRLWAMPQDRLPGEGPQAVPDAQPKVVEQRGVLQKISEVRTAIDSRQWLQAAEKFDEAWALTCDGDDPLLDRTGSDTQELRPGMTSLAAGGKSNLEQIFAGAPEEFRTEFSRQYDDVARQRILAVQSSDDLRDYRRVVGRYQFAPAAQEAMRTLARLMADEGDFIEAALLLNRIRSLTDTDDARLAVQAAWCYARAGLTNDAMDLLNAAVVNGRIEINGRLLDAPTDVSAKRAFLMEHFQSAETPTDRWLQPRGNYRRSALNERLPADMEPRWSASLLEIADVLSADRYNPTLQSFVEPFERAAAQYLRMNSTIIPASSALVDGSRVYVRSPVSIRAWDLKSGELLWEAAAPDRPLREHLDSQAREMEQSNEGEDVGRAPSRGGRGRGSFFDPRMMLFDQMIRTNTAAQISISGATLFAIEECAGTTWIEDVFFGVPASGNSSLPTNFVRAYDAETGVFLWEAGGQTQNATPVANGGPVNLLAGFYFLGAPLVLGERIYVLAESGEGIFLVRITPPVPGSQSVNPRIEASQMISVPRRKLNDHPLRKHAGLVPSFARGLLICPTCDDRIIAVSAEDLSIRWIFRYAGILRQQEIGEDSTVLFGGRDFVDTSRIDRDNRWTDFLPAISGSRVFATPRDSDQIFCLDLESGQQLWMAPRGAWHTIAAVSESDVVLVGNKSAAALDAATGEVLWQTEIRSGVVCGRPIATDTLLQIPTDAPEIVSIDRRTGRILVNQPWRGQGLPGNLTVSPLGVVSTGLTTVTTLATSESEPTPAAMATEFLLAGDVDAAREILQARISAAPNDRESRTLLIHVLLQLLRRDFAANSEALAEVRRLLRASAQDVAVAPVLHSLVGMNPADAAVLTEQLQGASRRQEAELVEIIAASIRDTQKSDLSDLADRLRDLIADLPEAHSEAVVSGFLTRSRADVLISGIRNVTSGRSRSEQNELADRLRTSTASVAETLDPGFERIQFVTDLIRAGLPRLSEDLIATGAVELPEGATPVLLEMARMELVRNGFASSVTVKTLLESWTSNDQKWAAYSWYRDLQAPDSTHSAFRWTLPVGATRQALLDEIASGNVPAPELPPTVWAAKCQTSESDDRSMLPPGRDQSNFPRSAIPFYGAPGLYRGWSFAEKADEETIVAYDPDGILKWQFKPLGVVDQGFQSFAAGSWVSSYGHLLIMNLNGTLIAIDGSSGDASTVPNVLWQRNIARLAPNGEDPSYRDFAPPQDRIPHYIPYPSGYFPAAPISAMGVPIIAGRRVLVLHPLSGEPVWQLDGIPQDAVLLSDQDELLVVSETARQIDVRSLIDGEQKSVVRLPEWWGDAIANVGSSVETVETEEGSDTLWRVIVEGRNCVLFRLTEGKSRLECRNLLTDAVEWSIDFPEQTVFSNVIGDVVAILCEGQQLKLVDVDSGTVLFDETITRMNTPSQLYLRASHGQYIIMPEARDEADPTLESINLIMDAVHLHGEIFAVSQKDYSLTWKRPVSHRHVRALIPFQSAPMLPAAPLLVLLARDGDGNPPVRNVRIRSEVLDVRTGELLYESANTGNTLNNHWLTLDSTTQVLHLSYEKRVVTFDLSGRTDAAAPK